MNQQRDRYIDAQATQYMDAVRETGRRSREQIGRVVEEASARILRRHHRASDPIGYLTGELREELIDLSGQLHAIERQLQSRINDLDAFVKEYTRDGRAEIIDTSRAYGAWRAQSLFGVPAAGAAGGADREPDAGGRAVDEAGEPAPGAGA